VILTDKISSRQLFAGCDPQPGLLAALVGVVPLETPVS